MLPFLQLETDFLTTGAPMAAAILRVPRQLVVGMAVDLIAFGVTATSTEEKPPDGVLLDPEAESIVEAIMGWQGPKGAAVDAFVRTGLVERRDIGLRVKGMDRYAAAWEAAAGRVTKAKTAAKKRWDTARSNAQAMLEHEPSMPQAHAPAMLGDAKKEIEKEKEIEIPSSSKKEKAPTLPLPQMPEDRFASGGAFFAWVQHERHAAGYSVERAPPPVSLGAWFSEALGELEGDTGRLEATLKGFVRDKYWLAKNLPFQAFMKKWRDYVPRRIAS